MASIVKKILSVLLTVIFLITTSFSLVAAINANNRPEASEKPEASEEPEGKFGEDRNENAYEHMSVVAKTVQELLQTRTTGGIGEEVRIVAREQSEGQNRVTEELQNLGERKGWMKRLLGVDRKVLKNIRDEIQQNEVRIEKLQKLLTQLTNQADKTVIQTMITALEQQNTSLMEVIKAEENTPSLFGWLAKLLEK